MALTDIAASSTDVAAILASDAPHTRAAKQIIDLGYKTSEAAVRRARTRPSTEVAVAEIVDDKPVLTLPLPDKVTSALAPVTPARIDIDSADGLTTTRVEAVTDLATALGVKQALDGQDCTVAIKATHAGTKLVVVSVADDTVEMLVAEARKQSVVNSFDFAGTYAGWLGEDYYMKERKVASQRGQRIENFPVLGPRTKRLLSALSELHDEGWHTLGWQSWGGMPVYQILINPEAVEQADTFYYKGPCVMNGDQITYVPTTGKTWQEAPPAPSRGRNDGPSMSVKWAKIPGGSSSPPPGLDSSTAWGSLGWWTEQTEKAWNE